MHFFKSNIILLVLHTIVTAAFLSTCPDKDIINPCTCEDYGDTVFCSDENMTLGSLRKSLNAFKCQNISIILLERLKLNVVPFDFFRGVNVKNLDIFDCELDSLSGGGEKPLQGLENTLEKLNIKSSFKEHDTPAKLSVSHLQRLREIYLDRNSINVLGDDWFENTSSSLKIVHLNGNEIMTIGKKAFADIKNLEHLTVIGNRFGSISRSMMPYPAEKLQYIGLENNGLKNLPDDLFTSMPSLKFVHLSNNGLTVIPENVWKNIWGHLIFVFFKDNPIICDDDMHWMMQTPTCAKIWGKCKYPRLKRGQNIPYVVRDKNCSRS